MGTNTDTLWLFFLSSKFNLLSPPYALFSFITILFIWVSLSLFFWAHPGGPAWGKYYSRRPGPRARPIPGPMGLPFLGSMGLMMGLAHQKIILLARQLQAKRLMAFSLGNSRVIVSCHPHVSKEILTGSTFVDRPVKESANILLFNRAIGFAPYGSYWQLLRRISTVHMFCPKQIKAGEAQRAQIAAQMVSLLGQTKGPFQAREVLKRASLSNMMGLVFGKGYDVREEIDETASFRGLVDEGYELLGVLNWGEYIPWISEWDPQKIRFRCANLVPKVNRFVGRIIQEHRAEPGRVDRDFVDVLLSLQGCEKLSDSDMIAVLWEMIFRGTDAVAVLMEWILARMVLHPNIQSTVQNELDVVVGASRAVDESDLPSLPYLTAVIKEALRLHPPGPLLSWCRLAIEDTVVDGYHVPAGTTAMVNMWAIARDPEIWADPLEFRPERFLNGPNFEFSVFGSDLRLAPFGAGRRACPGKQLGMNTVSCWVAALLHEFEWVASGLDATVDLSEVLKLSCEMASPLTVEVRLRHRSK